MSPDDEGWVEVGPPAINEMGSVTWHFDEAFVLSDGDLLVLDALIEGDDWAPVRARVERRPE